MLKAVLFSAVALSILSAMPARAEDAKPDGKERFFEMRTYYPAEGKLEALLKRFRDHTCKLFEKHGMTNVGYWVPSEGADAGKILVYVLSYPDKEARDKAWKEFQADPDWQKAKSESEVNGKLVEKVVSVFMKPTDFSPIK